MARFKIGDKVVMNEHISNIPYGSVGIVIEEARFPDIAWSLGDNTKKIWAVDEDLLKSIDPASEISKIINHSLERENSWDDSVEISESMDLPVDRFEFRYQDEYGRELSHKFEQSEGDYDLCDVIASFRLFILGIGWDREDVDKYIREDRL